MTKISFKKEHKEGLFTYLHVHNSSYQSMTAAKEQPMTYPDREASNPIVYQPLFYNYLSLAQYCCRNLEKYCILHSSPDTLENVNIDKISPAGWWYNLLSNDYDGLGVDLGFTREKSFTVTYSGINLFSVDSFLSLNTLPEDLFGEAVSQLTLFGLKKMRTEKLQSFLQSPEKPEVNNLLLEGELFSHIVVAKEVGYYNSLLIKSGKDIEKDLDEYPIIINTTTDQQT